MKPGRTGATVTGWLLLILGGAMALIIGKGDLNVISAGIFTSFGGIYVLSLVDPTTRQFIGDGWPAKFCRLSAVVVGLLMLVSGLIGSIDGIRETLIFQNTQGLSFALIGLLPICWGIYIVKLVIGGVRS